MEILAITTTLATLADAQALARSLVAQRLAACVQVDTGLQSFYRWEGRVCGDPEVRLTIKTLPGRRAAVAAHFAAHHPYDTPQFLAVAMEADEGYGAWVRAEVGGG